MCTPWHTPTIFIDCFWNMSYTSRNVPRLFHCRMIDANFPILCDHKHHLQLLQAHDLQISPPVNAIRLPAHYRIFHTVAFLWKAGFPPTRRINNGELSFLWASYCATNRNVDKNAGSASACLLRNGSIALDWMRRALKKFAFCPEHMCPFQSLGEDTIIALQIFWLFMTAWTHNRDIMWYYCCILYFFSFLCFDVLI